MSDSPRLGIHRPVGADNFAIASDLQDAIDTLDDAAIDQQGTLAARPAANAVPSGTYYFTIDELKLYRSDGVTWNYVIPDGSISTAMLADDAVTAAKVGLQSVGTVAVGAKALAVGAAAWNAAGTERLETNPAYVDVVAATSRIKAVVAGLYQFSCFAKVNGACTGWEVNAWKNGLPAGPPPIASVGFIASAGSGDAMSSTMVLSLAANDYIQLGGSAATGTPDMSGYIHAVYLGPAS